MATRSTNAKETVTAPTPAGAGVGGAARAPSISDCAKMSVTCACYNLRRASRAVTQLFDSYFDEVGLKATQFTVLSALAYSDDKPPTIGELAEILILDQSSLSRNLGVLERLGYIRLAAGNEDRRERIVTLTRPGRAALAKGYPVWRRVQGAIATALENSELDNQLRSLRRLTKTAQELRPTKTRRAGSTVSDSNVPTTTRGGRAQKVARPEKVAKTAEPLARPA